MILDPINYRQLISLIYPYKLLDFEKISYRWDVCYITTPYPHPLQEAPYQDLYVSIGHLHPHPLPQELIPLS